MGSPRKAMKTMQMTATTAAIPTSENATETVRVTNSAASMKATVESR